MVDGLHHLAGVVSAHGEPTFPRPRRHDGPLVEVAATLRPLLPAEQRTALDEVVERAMAGRARILVVGEAKRGKSTLVNALFNRDPLTTGSSAQADAPTPLSKPPGGNQNMGPRSPKLSRDHAVRSWLVSASP